MYKYFPYQYKPPYPIKKMFNDFQWESKTEKNLITFDDGPNPGTTEIILDELDQLNIKTVFFCVGENLEKYPHLAEDILNRGHEIGNHTYSHEKLRKMDNFLMNQSIKKVQDFTHDTFNYRIKYFRPPHGRFTLSTKRVLKENMLSNVMWTLLTYDYKNDINIVKFAVSKYLRDNSIIVLHDSNKSKEIIVDAINFIHKKSNEKNYLIGKPSECLKFYS